MTELRNTRAGKTKRMVKAAAKRLYLPDREPMGILELFPEQKLKCRA